MIINYNSFLLESRYTCENIDKKYYVWKVSGFIRPKYAVIEIILCNGGNISYKALLRSDSDYKDFFTNSKLSNMWNKLDKVSLSYWKRHKAGGLIFDTNNKEDAIEFYKMYINDNSITPENFVMHKDINKYNL